MNKKKYVVAVVEGLTTKDLDKELSAPTGSSTVPHRAVELYDPRHENPRMTDWLLTDEEAAALRKDERVFFVNPKCTSPLSTYSNDLDKTQYAQFWAYDTHDHLVNPNSFAGLHYFNAICTKGDVRNAGLYMHSQQDRTNIDPLNTHEGLNDNVLVNNTEGLAAGQYDFGQGLIDVNDYVQGYNAVMRVCGTNTHRWEYDGEGVDWVCIDSGIYASHPEFADEDGNTRVQKIDWYGEAISRDDYATDTLYNQAKNAAALGINDEPRMDHNGYENDEESGQHGTHVTSIACGKKHGWAKKAHIYVCPYPWLENDKVLAGEEVTVTEKLAKAFDLVLAWHKNKTNGRPTVLNLSIGLNYQTNAMWWNANYRGQDIPSPFKSGDADRTLFDSDDYLRTLDGELWLPVSSGEWDAKEAEIDAEDYDGPWTDVKYYMADQYWTNTIQGVEWRKHVDFAIDNKFAWNYGLNGNDLSSLMHKNHVEREYVRDADGNLVMGDDGQWETIVLGERSSPVGLHHKQRGNWATDVNTGVVDGMDIQLAYEQMIQEGMHVVTAADNSNQFHAVENAEDMDCDVFDGAELAHQDWNNYVDATTQPERPHGDARSRVMYDQPHLRVYPQRPPIPYHKDSLNVGSLGTRKISSNYNELTNKIVKSKFSSYGPAVNIYACGEDIIAAAAVKRHNSWHDTFTPYETDVEKYPELDGYYNLIQGGTSMAAPQVSGIMCQYIQKYPNKSPSEIRQIMIKESMPARHIEKGFVGGGNDPYSWFKIHNDKQDQGYIDKQTPYDAYMYYLDDYGGATDPVKFPNQNGAGPINVVVSPYSGTGSLTIENSGDTHDADTGKAKRLHLISGDVFNYPELQYVTDTGRVKLTLYNVDVDVSPIPNLPVTIKVENLNNGEINYYTNKFGSDGYIITDDLNLDVDTYGYAITADVMGTYFVDTLYIGDSTKVISPDQVTIADDTVAGTAVYTVNTLYPDDVIELDASSSPYVQLDPNTGIITLSEDTDIDVRSEYSFTINTTKLGGSNTTSKTIKIVVQSTEIIGPYLSQDPIFNNGVNTNNDKIHAEEVRDFKNELVGLNVLYDQGFDSSILSRISLYFTDALNAPPYNIEVIKSEGFDDNVFDVTVLAGFTTSGDVKSQNVSISVNDFSNLSEHDFTVIFRLTDSEGNTKDFTINLTVFDGSVPLWRGNVIDPLDLTENVDYANTIIYETYADGVNDYDIVSYEMCNGTGDVINDEFFYVDKVEKQLDDGSYVTAAQVRLKKPVDYEDSRTYQNAYTYNLLATQSNGGSSIKPVSHTVIDVMDTFEAGLEVQSSYIVDYGFFKAMVLDEDVATGTVLGTVAVTNFGALLDEDLMLITPTVAGQNIDTTPVSLVKHDTYESTWNIVVDSSLDYESDPTFNLIFDISFVNPADGQSENINEGMAVQVQNVDDTGPVFSGPTAYNFLSDQAVDSVLFTATAPDSTDDIVSNPVTFSKNFEIIMGAATSFLDVASNGEVTLAQDFVNSKTIVLSIKATDAAGNDTSRVYTIVVDNAPSGKIDLSTFQYIPTEVLQGLGGGHTDQTDDWYTLLVEYENPTTYNTGYVIIGAEVTANPFYENDFAIAAWQVLDADGNVLYTYSAYNYMSQSTTTNQSLSQLKTPLDSFNDYTWAQLGSLSNGQGGTNARWHRGYSTGSSNTGPNNGPYSMEFSGAINVSPNYRPSQYSPSPYLFHEASGSNRFGYRTYLRNSNPMTLPREGQIRIIYFNSGTNIDGDKSLLIGMTD